MMKPSHRISAIIIALLLTASQTLGVLADISSGDPSSVSDLTAGEAISSGLFEDQVLTLEGAFPEEDDISGALVEDYLLHCAEDSEPSPLTESDEAEGELPHAQSSRGYRLSGQTLIAYNAMLSASKKIAAGKQSSTIVRIPVSKLLKKTKYTAKELGVSSTILGSSINPAARDALYDKINLDASKALYSLSLDAPYELYWYDKVYGALYTSTGHYYAEGSGKSSTIEFSSDAAVLFKLPVSADYSKNGVLDGYTADTAKTGAAAKAAKTAASIVSANKSKEDYAKLVAYRDTICNLVSYDTSAASSSSRNYGDPWQLIYVFDGNTSTKVVCEGYSKAFKFLCDLSTFKSNWIECRIMTGTLSDGTSSGSGAHMWNIVRMNDGKNYLVDVTNCDSDKSSAYRNILFLKGSASGSKSNANAQTILAGSKALTYTYDDMSKRLYTASERTIAAKDYDSLGTKTAKIKLAGARIRSVSDRVYTGKARTQTPKVVVDGRTLRKNVDYRIRYKNNKKVGKATMILTGIGQYSGTVKKTFRVLPKATKITKLTSTGSSIRVKWQKRTTQTSGYQIQASLKKSFKGKKTVTVKKAKTTSATVRKLKSKRTYYVRVRTYRKVSGKKYYSAWSKVKKIRTK